MTACFGEGNTNGDKNDSKTHLEEFPPLINPLHHVIALQQADIPQLSEAAGDVPVVVLGNAIEYLQHQRLLLELWQRQPAELQQLVEGGRATVGDEPRLQELEL